MLTPSTLVFYTSYLWALSQALQVSPNSTCAAVCLDHPDGDPLDPAASTTNYTDIACRDADYLTSSTGIKFKNCVECLQDSRNVNSGENDISWFLYNLRYATDVCLYGFPVAVTNISSPCNINFACQPLKTALESGNLNPDNDTEFGYCSADNGEFSVANVEACVQCLQSSTEQVYMSNFLIALSVGCQQKPKAGDLLGLSGSLFTKTAVNMTAPPDDQPLTTSVSTNPMTTGAIVGIAVGAALLFLGGTALFIVYYRKQKAMYDQDVKSGYDPRAGSSSISPPLKGGYSSYDPKQISNMSDYELRAQQQYSNAEYYDKIEEEMVFRRPNYNFDPNNPSSGHQGALPTHPAYIPRAMSRNSTRAASPQPPPPVKSNKPDSYALQTYLSAGEESAALRIPPPPPRGAPGGPKSVQRDASPSGAPIIGPAPPPKKGSIQAQRQAPPPPAQPKVPSLILPSVPRIRLPKKYAPPSINIQGATPISGPGEGPSDMNISEPISRNAGRRFPDEQYAGRRSRNASPDSRSDAPLIEGAAPIEHTVIDRPPRGLFYEEVELRTGKSSMFG